MGKTTKKTPKGKSEEVDNTLDWGNRTLGADERYLKVSDQGTENRLDDGLDLQMVSLRLPKGAIEDLKKMSRMNGLGYQPFIRQILINYLRNVKK